MKYTCIYTDSEGTSHFEDRDIELTEVDFSPPTPPLYLSAFSQASQFAFCQFPAGWFGDWHPTPHNQYFFFISGEIEMKVSDGEVRRFGPGSIILLEDIGGKGHTTRVISSEAVLAAVVQLPD